MASAAAHRIARGRAQRLEMLSAHLEMFSAIEGTAAEMISPQESVLGASCGVETPQFKRYCDSNYSQLPQFLIFRSSYRCVRL
jgi:hypothetical protein